MASDLPRRRLVARYGFIAAAALLLSLLTAVTAGGYLTRLGGDLVLPVASSLAKQPPSKVSLVVIDEVTHRTPPFSETPEVAWMPHLARVLDAVGAAQPQVIGLDVVYPKTLASPDLLPGFDQPFLKTLATLGRSGKLVLSELRFSDGAITPYQGQRLAVGGVENLAPVTVSPDLDSVIRLHPATQAREDGTRAATFAAELAARAGHPAKAPFLVDFSRPAADFPTYRLSDLYNCLEMGKTGVFDAFAGQVVLIGVDLDVEDRHLAANRFAADKSPTIRPAGCGETAKAQATPRLTMPGVLLQAYAVDTLFRGSAPKTLSAALTAAASLAAFLLLGLIFLRLRPVKGALAWLGFAALAWLAAVLALAHGTQLPWLQWAVGGAVFYAAAYGYRTMVEDRGRRAVTHAFGRYLSPALVDQLAQDPGRLKLGGEHRRVAVMFVDLEGFVPYSEKHAAAPERIAAHLNVLFSRISEIVEAHGGYVDKFMGDAVMAVWGAPADCEGCETAAARAALEIVAAVRGLEQAEGETPYRVRVGLSAGMVLAGNLGSSRRFNYTVIGEAVNLAARLQEAGKTFKTGILADVAFIAALDGFASRRVAAATPRGMTRAIEIYELLPQPPAAGESA